MPPVRPKHLALWQIRLPVPGIVSILHRISGVSLFFAFPFLLYGLQSLLSFPERLARLQGLASHPLSKLLILFLGWAFLHHLFAGLRFLLLDIHWGVKLKHARVGAMLVLIASLSCTLLIGWRLW